jgi:hypothetical protein
MEHTPYLPESDPADLLGERIDQEDPDPQGDQSGGSAAEGDHGCCPRCGHPLRPGRSSLIPDPAEHPTVPVWPVVGMVFGKKRSAILELARRGRLPVRVLRIGGSYRVATAELLRVLGQDK